MKRLVKSIFIKKGILSLMLILAAMGVNAQTLPTSTLFSDDVWFFGQNEGAAEGSTALGTNKTSKGIIFRNINGVITATDGSGISLVNSWENSISVSSPSCNGSIIFYAQHDKIYNSNHQQMLGGTISGHTSTGDGLAAAYLGDNKYIFISVTNQLNTGNLAYGIVDMNQDNGYGQYTSKGLINNTGRISEAIELIPVVEIGRAHV